MKRILIKNAQLVNEGKITSGDVLIKGQRIEKIAPTIDVAADEEIDAEGLFLLPGIIDDQVHFREPGLTHKANIHSEARAAVAGGVTSFMEMPNTVPNAVTLPLLEDKFNIAAKTSVGNYSFFFGATNNNIEEVEQVDPKRICGVKIFMGSSTGNMLVDKEQALEEIFSRSPVLIATHCEDEEIIRRNAEEARFKYGENVPMHLHPEIRSAEACYKSSSHAVELAKKFGTRLHILHISTAIEINLFENIPLKGKKITAEVCVHHLWFDDEDYDHLGSKIKCNPAIKTTEDRKALLHALKNGHLDIIATDHAPHTREEKSNTYFNAPSGVPLVQHSLNMMLEFYHQGQLPLEMVVEKMCHAPAECFQVKERGYLREGYFADLVLVDLNERWTVHRPNIYYKCGWSPFEGQEFRSKVKKTFVNGHLAYDDGRETPFDESVKGMRLEFDR